MSVARAAFVLAALAGVSAEALAADVEIPATKLLIVDQVAAKGKAKVVFVAKAPAVTKGAGTDPAAISAGLIVGYDGAGGAFTIPLGASGGGAGWTKNDVRQAKYRNPAASTGAPTGVKAALVKNGKLLKLVALTRGDDALDLIAAGAPMGDLTTVFSVTNGAETFRFCTTFAPGSATMKPIAGGAGRKLLAKNGQPGPCRGRTTISMAPDLPQGFFSMPWPNDVRHHPDGTLDLDGWPGRDVNALLDQVLAAGGGATTAFGVNSATFLQATAPLDPASLPTASTSTGADATVMLADLDGPGGPRAPVLTDFKVPSTTFRPANLLSALPYPGHPLREQSRYAAIVFAGVRDADGLRLAPSPLLKALSDPWDPSKPTDAATWDALRAQRDDVLAYVDQHTSWSSAQVVGFTLFTTQDVTGEMDAIAAGVAALPSPAPVSRTSGTCGTVRTTVSGTLDLPRWQAGTPPYLTTGGGIVVSSGVAVQQGIETVQFRMTFPCGPAPAAGWPILLYMDGTGGSAHSTGITEIGGTVSPPYVVASIAPLFSGDRTIPMAPLPPELLFFNYLNPLAGRTNQLQQAADMMYLRRVVEGITLSAAETGAPGPVATDDSLVVIAGHSQGALTVPHVLAVDPAFDAGFISAGGAGFYNSILYRGDTRPLVDGLLGTPPTELDPFHPVLHALQTLAEVGDAAAYARRGTSAHVLATSGLDDGCSPLEVTTFLGTAAGLQLANPLLHPVFGTLALEPTTVALPAAGNLPGGRTGVLVQLDTGHFGAHSNPSLGNSFVVSLAGTGVATVAPGLLLPDFTPGCAGRFGPLPTP